MEKLIFSLTVSKDSENNSLHSNLEVKGRPRDITRILARQIDKNPGLLEILVDAIGEHFATKIEKAIDGMEADVAAEEMKEMINNPKKSDQ